MSINDINPGEVVIKHTGESEDDNEPSFSQPSAPFTPQTGDGSRQKPMPSDLKEYTLNKFNTLEPFLIKQLAHFKDNMRTLEQQFQEKLSKSILETSESATKKFNEQEFRFKKLNEIDANLGKNALKQQVEVGKKFIEVE